MQLARLEGFYWVAKVGGYARAARAFPYPITQPGVYQQVRKLEGELGVTLFERVGKDRVILTPAGHTLYAAVCPFYEHLAVVESALAQGRYGGRLRIHAAGQVLRRLLPRWLLRARRRRPDIDIELIEVGNPEVDSLRRGACDLLVDYVPSLPSETCARQVGAVRPFIVAPVRHRAAKQQRITLEHFGDDPFIAYDTGRRHRDLQMQALADAGVRPGRLLSASSSDTILALVEAGLGYSVIPSFAAKGPRRHGVVARPLMPPVEFPILAVWRKTDPTNPLIEAFMALAPG